MGVPALTANPLPERRPVVNRDAPNQTPTGPQVARGPAVHTHVQMWRLPQSIQAISVSVPDRPWILPAMVALPVLRSTE